MISYITYAQLAIDTRLLLKNIPQEVTRRLVGVLGVPRSGMLPATMIGMQLHLPVGDTDSFGLTTVFPIPGKRLHRYNQGDLILVVDDSAYAGTSMAAVRQSLQTLGMNFIYAVVYRNPEKSPELDYFGRDVEAPRYFEWNLLQHPDSTGFMLDIDGVVCYDPPVFDDDGEVYQKNLLEAIPLHLPKRTVEGLCTMRIERWRGITESWMADNGVTFNKLWMAPYVSAAVRRASVTYGAFKGDCYSASRATLFIESSRRQSISIQQRSQKPVICLSTGEIFQ